MVVDSEDGTSDEDHVQSPPPNSQWRSLFRFTTTSHYLVLFLALIFAILSGVIVPALAYFLGKTFNAFTVYGAGLSTSTVFLRDVTRHSLYVVILGAMNSILSSGFLFHWLIFGELQVKAARYRLYSCMLDKEMEWFDMGTSGISALMPRVHRCVMLFITGNSADRFSLIRDLQLATSQPLGFLIQYSCSILAALGLAFYSAWDLTLVVIASAPIGALILGLISKRLQPYIKAQSEYLEDSTKHAAAALNAIETVKCSNAQDFELSQYLDSTKQAAAQYVSQAQLSAVQFGVVRFLILAIFVQGFWYGSHLVQIGSKDSSQILTAFWACLIATQTFEGLLQHLLVLDKGRLAGQILYSIVTNIDEASNLGSFEIIPDHCDGDVQMAEVSEIDDIILFTKV